MTSRFTETNKWMDPWFRNLKPQQKSLWEFLRDSCDNSGFWEIDFKLAAFMTGISESDIESDFKALARGYLGPAKGLIYIRNFLEYQKNLTLNPENRFHSVIMQSLQKRIDFDPFIQTIFDCENKTLPRPLVAPTHGATRHSHILSQGHSQSKNNKKKFNPNAVELPKNLDTQEFREVWTDWNQHRVEKKKKQTPLSVKRQIKKLSGWGLKRAVHAVNVAIEKGWKGIWELDDDGKKKSTYEQMMETEEKIKNGII